MRPVTPLHALHIHQPQIRLVDEPRRAERVAGAFSTQPYLGEPPQLLVDDGEHAIHRLGISFPPAAEHLGDVGHGAEGAIGVNVGAMKNPRVVWRLTR